MKFYIVIPAHNEADSIALTIESLIAQTITPTKLVIVNDHSTDATGDIVSSYMQNHPWISLINVKSEDKHLPGSKIINAFYKGLNSLDEDYDIICKFDADLIFPANYLETIAYHFNANPKLGMAAGFCYIKQNNDWVLEGLTNKDHIRGALKAYRKQCFSDIGQLKPAMGWDTIDELLAKFYHWDILTDESLHVKHLKPTGASYNKSSKYMQGEAMYRMRYGLTITAISALKLALKKKNISLFKDYMAGYFKARTNKTEALVTKEQGVFIRKLRWQGMLQKFKA